MTWSQASPQFPPAAPTGSVTAVIKIGVSLIRFAAAWAVGVAIARIRVEFVLELLGDGIGIRHVTLGILDKVGNIFPFLVPVFGQKMNKAFPGGIKSRVFNDLHYPYLQGILP